MIVLIVPKAEEEAEKVVEEEQSKEKVPKAKVRVAKFVYHWPKQNIAFVQIISHLHISTCIFHHKTNIPHYVIPTEKIHSYQTHGTHI